MYNYHLKEKPREGPVKLSMFKQKGGIPMADVKNVKK